MVRASLRALRARVNLVFPPFSFAFSSLRRKRLLFGAFNLHNLVDLELLVFSFFAVFIIHFLFFFILVENLLVGLLLSILIVRLAFQFLDCSVFVVDAARLPPLLLRGTPGSRISSSCSSFERGFCGGRALV